MRKKKGVKEHKSGWTFQGAPCLSWEQEKDVFDAIENRKKSWLGFSKGIGEKLAPNTQNMDRQEHPNRQNKIDR